MSNSADLSQQTVLHRLLERKKNSGSLTSMRFKDAGQWRQYTWDQVVEMTEAASLAIAEIGIEKDDRVAIICETRPEWTIADYAILGAGGVTVPIYPNNHKEDVEFILNDSEAKVLIVEDQDQIEKWISIQKNCPTVKKVIAIDKVDDTQAVPWLDLLSQGRELAKASPHAFRQRAEQAKLDDWATLLYTSGTTGRPKGVVLNHEQLMSELIDVYKMFTLDGNDTALTFLPFSHIFGRVESFGSAHVGYVMAFAESIEKLRSNFSEVQPTFILAVPRIFEKLYSAILAQAQNNPIKKRLFDWAIEVGHEYSKNVREKKSISPLLIGQYALAKRLVFDTILKGLGGKMRFAASGGAPLSIDISVFFHSIGLLILEGYGLTESTAGIIFNSPLNYKLGTVGPAVGDVELKIAEDGELLVKSKKIMKRYYHDDAATEEIFAGGYFHTGDIAEIDSEGFVKITDRKKDLIKTAGGKYVAPQKLETMLKSSQYVSNVLIHGDQKKYIVALITLNEPTVKSWARGKGLEFKDSEELSQTPEVYSLIRGVLADINAQLASYESIKKFAILPVDFSVETGELTPSLKVKRKVCDKKFAKEIAQLYGAEA